MNSTVIINMTTTNFVLDFEKIFFFEDGCLVESGRPQKLLLDEKSALHKETKNVDPNLITSLKNKMSKGRTKNATNTFLSSLAKNQSPEKQFKP